MDPLSITCSIATVIATVDSLLKYLRDVKERKAELVKLENEIKFTANVLRSLAMVGSDSTAGDPWQANILTLESKEGPLWNFTLILNELVQIVRAKSLLDAATYPWKKRRIEGLQSQLERYKTLFKMALQLDNSCVRPIPREVYRCHLSLTHCDCPQGINQGGGRTCRTSP